MKTYYARHSGDLALDNETLKRLRAERVIAIHFPYLADGSGTDEDTRCIDPDRYESKNKGALRCLSEISSKGGYVCAAYRDTRRMTIGRIQPGTPVVLREERWSEDSKYPGRKAILKTLAFAETIEVPASRQSLLLSVQPTKGTLCTWHGIGNKIECLMNGTSWAKDFSSLHPSYQEVMCSEFLRNHDIPGMPRLSHLLQPVGRTMTDVDILGVAEDGRIMRAQVTFTASQDKLSRLAAYGSKEGNHLVFFCASESMRSEKGVAVVPVDHVFEHFTSSASGAAWFARANDLI